MQENEMFLGLIYTCYDGGKTDFIFLGSWRELRKIEDPAKLFLFLFFTLEE